MPTAHPNILPVLYSQQYDYYLAIGSRVADRIGVAPSPYWMWAAGSASSRHSMRGSIPTRVLSGSIAHLPRSRERKNKRRHLV